MATSSAVFEAMYEYYSALTKRSMGVVRGLREDILREQFEPKRFMAQALGLWLDASVGWWSALQVSTAPQLAGLFVGVPAGQVGKATLAIRIPREGSLSVTKPKSEQGETLPGVTVEAGAQRDELVATVKTREETTPGVYQGWVHAGEQVLAVLVVRVTPRQSAREAKPGRGARRSRRR